MSFGQRLKPDHICACAYTYFDVLISCGMMRRAIDEGQRLLELCENDNLGVRYQLMHLYAYMEDEMHALALHKQFDSYEETPDAPAAGSFVLQAESVR